MQMPRRAAPAAPTRNGLPISRRFLGLKTRQAVKAMQIKYGLPADSYPTAELLARMRSGH
jgi:hypothetical protein